MYPVYICIFLHDAVDDYITKLKETDLVDNSINYVKYFSGTERNDVKGQRYKKISTERNYFIKRNISKQRNNMKRLQKYRVNTKRELTIN